MKEVSRKLKLGTLKVSPSAISSPESAAGPSPSSSPESATERLSGREARHASRLVQQGDSSDSSTLGTLRRYSSTSSASAALQDCLGSKLRPQLENRGCAIYKFTWKEKATPSGLPYSQLAASVPRIKESDSFSGPTNWPTPTARDWKDGGECLNVPTNSLLGREVWGGGVANTKSAGWRICDTANIWATDAPSDAFTDASNSATDGKQRFTAGWADPRHSFWSDADWLGCRDGKFRPVESGTFPLANGIPARVGRLRGYGNAIVPQVAAEFIAAFMEAARATFEV